MFAALNAFQVGGGSAAASQQAYTTAGTYSWTCPVGVTSVSVVCVGAAVNSLGGGALAYKNNITFLQSKHVRYVSFDQSQ